jgi:ATP-dependent phosphofructokinase / diphosphate-dependent phosphofructokinase
MALKGNLVIGQSGGPTAVINASLYGVIMQAREHPEIDGVYGSLAGITGILNERMIDLRAEPEVEIQRLRSTPSAALGSCRKKLAPADYERILSVFQAHNIRYFCYAGGNDSADTSYRISMMAQEAGYELRVMGIPKTIDNDLAYTDHCPGYGSVARFNAMAIRDAGKDTEAIGIVDNVKIIETMGRNAGWITAAAALGRECEDDAPHLIYLPERPLREEQVLNDVKRVFDRLGFCVIAVCEGVKGESGEVLAASKKAVDVDSFGHPQLGGAADYVCKLVSGNLGLKARFDKPGTIQRMFALAASPVDIDEAEMVGRVAVRAMIEGTTGQMVTLVRTSNTPYTCTTGLALLQEVANAEKLMPDEFINAEGNFVTPAFLNYAQPLIGPTLPAYTRLAKQLVAKKLA